MKRIVGVNQTTTDEKQTLLIPSINKHIVSFQIRQLIFGFASFIDGSVDWVNRISA